MLTSAHLTNMVTCVRKLTRKWSHISCIGTVTISDRIPLSGGEVFIHVHKYNLSIEKLTGFCLKREYSVLYVDTREILCQF